MTLVCQCGGVLEIESQSYTKETAFESYECLECGRTGSLRHDNSGTTLSGCVTRQ